LWGVLSGPELIQAQYGRILMFLLSTPALLAIDTQEGDGGGGGI